MAVDGRPDWGIWVLVLVGVLGQCSAIVDDWTGLWEWIRVLSGSVGWRGCDVG